MFKLGVLGRGIGYSLSPKIHLEFAKQLNYQIEYLIYDVDKDPISFIHKFFSEGGFGLNITKPYKDIVAHEFNPELVSVNCIYEKGLKANSTDGLGLTNDLYSKNIDYKNMNILVYGLGGAANSILQTINTCKKIYISNRTPNKITNIAKKKNNLLEYSGEDVDLIINCASSLDLNTLKDFEHFSLKKNGYIYDINYSNNTNINLKTLADSKKVNFHNGAGMLVEQAAECFRLWFNQKPHTTEVKNLLNERF
jgi:shikimate dehydrogenase